MGDPQMAPASPPSSGMTMPPMLASLGRAELFMAAGAALIVLVDLVFVIFGPYGFSNVAWAAAVVVLLLIFAGARMFSISTATVRSLLLLLGAFMLVAGVRDVLDDLQFLNGANVAATYFLGAIGYYVGVALAVFGAWQLWGRKNA